MREQLLNSRTVKLEGLGTFTLVCQSRCKGVDEEADVSPAQITGLRCQFTPEYTRDAGGNITRALIQGATYIHVNQLTKALGAGGGGNAGGSGDDKPSGGGQEAPDPAA